LTPNFPQSTLEFSPTLKTVWSWPISLKKDSSYGIGLKNALAAGKNRLSGSSKAL
jgi:hypothetical protein